MKNAGSGVGNETKAAIGPAMEEAKGFALKPKGGIGPGSTAGASAELNRQHPTKHTDYGAKQHDGKADHVRHEPLHGMSPRAKK